MASSPCVNVPLLQPALVENEIRLIAQRRGALEAAKAIEGLDTADEAPLRSSRSRVWCGRRERIASECDNAVELLSGHASVDDEGTKQAEDVGRVEVEVATGVMRVRLLVRGVQTQE